MTFIRFSWSRESLIEFPYLKQYSNAMSGTNYQTGFYFFSKTFCPIHFIFTLTIGLKLSKIYLPSFYSPAASTEELKISNWMQGLRSTLQNDFTLHYAGIEIRKVQFLLPHNSPAGPAMVSFTGCQAALESQSHLFSSPISL